MSKINKKRTGKHLKMPGVNGVLDVSPHGIGFVSVPGMAVDIKIKKENLKDAMKGDTVEVSIIKINETTHRAEGIVNQVVKRGQQELIGIVDKNMNYAFVIPDNKSFTKDIFINERNAKNLKSGDRVIVRITDWSGRMKNPEGEIVDVLNDERMNDLAMKEIVLSQGFSLEFRDIVKEELKQISEIITPHEIAQRKDCREIFTITIDPHDAKDFDDAISFRRLENGHFEIGVHIADVSHYVKPATALDQEAFQRATSVYLPDRVIPMLPEKISNELCSLRPLEDKLTYAVIYEMDGQGKVYQEWIGRTIIHSNHRFIYEEVQDIIETKEGLYKEEVLQLNSISRKIREARFKQGAINFSSEEIRFKLDEHNVPIDVIIKESKECHQLIEELMLMANKSVAIFVGKQTKHHEKVPFPYRIHDSPDMEKLIPFTKFAAKMGYQFNLKTPQTIAESFNKMVEGTNKNPEHKILQTLGIRTMAKAVYSPENIGHYGLAFEHYCHFTSPIRRYPDVMVHRILTECLDQNIQPVKNMEELCIHCSDQERKAMEAEREANKYKQVEFMQKFLGHEVKAVISGVAAHGFWAQTIDHKCEGFVSMAQLLEHDEFIFQDGDYAIVGQRSKRKFFMGQVITVQIVATNLLKRQIDFDIVMNSTE